MAADHAAAQVALESLCGELRKMRLPTGMTLYDVHARRLSIIHLDITNVAAVAAGERAAGEPWFVAICRTCWPEAQLVPDVRLVGEMPFRSVAERGKWCGEHTRGTGHDSWLLLETAT